MSPVPELAAFAEECLAAGATLAAASGADASAPGLGDWSLGELVGHLVGVAGRLDHLAGLEAPTGPVEVDRHLYYAREPSWGFDEPVLAPDTWAASLAAASAATVSRFEQIGRDAPLPSPCGTITAVEYLATRVLEVTVHHMDVRAALDEPPVATPAAGRLTLDLLERLLEGPRPRNFGRTRFILAATGRVEVDDPRFPVLP